MKIIVVTAESRAESVIVIEHRSHAIETKTIELKFFQPVADVGEQEVPHLRFGVVETPRVPDVVIAARTIVKKLIGRTIVAGNAFELVLDRMRMHQVHDHLQPHAVGGIDQLFQLIRRAKARGRCEKGTDMIAEAAVVGMLLHRHQLHRVVACTGDAR